MFFTAVVSVLVSSVAVVAQYGNPPPAQPTTSTAPPVPSAPANTDPNVINVNVAPNGQFMFDPANFTAPVNATVTFFFPNSGLDHSVTQSSFEAPCTYLTASSNNSAGFDSGLIFLHHRPLSQASADQFTIVITDDQPIYFHCKQVTHCGLGMVGTINAPTNGTNTFAAFQAAASKIGSSEVTETDHGPVTGGFNAIASLAPSATATVSGGSAPSSGMKVVASVGALFLSGLAIGAALL
ncbi:hypothetical protein MSAN_01296400 [Mycena sanguinolenta]|uniref:Blue (type 1) copper domain-containing protein n=1 Tax=Mycena sanguinolenta TaxID=230812 RepID=A0A8H7D5H1_9AGAR|nr:hypothetical protein MSAN_01296400 [Mycena sanguinolenta]